VGAVAFVFQRDFRIEDNPGFLRAAESAGRGDGEDGGGRRRRLVPAFLMDDRQLDPGANPYRSDKCVRLMAECLAELSGDLRRAGWPGVVLLDAGRAAMHLSRLGVTEVHHNADFTPFARSRDAGLRRALEGAGVRVVVTEEPEYTLWRTGAIRTGAGGAYKVYTPFVRACERAAPPRDPDYSSFKRLRAGRPRRRGAKRPPASGGDEEPGDHPPTPKHAPAPGSEAQAEFVALFRSAVARRHRARALATLRDVAEGGFASYPKTRDMFAGWPENGGTTGLSVPMKFGRVSCREVYKSFVKNPALLRELMWREFYAHVAAGHPGVLAGQLRPAEPRNRHELEHRDRAVDGWKHGPEQRRALRLWSEGRTGEPLVDAAMRNLASTGRLHNRLRMVAASHLVKTMGVDWRRGEAVFASMLLDYDPASNGGGWRAMDAQAPGREIRAAAQAKKHDRRGDYVSRWLA
jgi:deoxyribodipyrimidine photo-lyase